MRWARWYSRFQFNSSAWHQIHFSKAIANNICNRKMSVCVMVFRWLQNVVPQHCFLSIPSAKERDIIFPVDCSGDISPFCFIHPFDGLKNDSWEITFLGSFWIPLALMKSTVSFVPYPMSIEHIVISGYYKEDFSYCILINEIASLLWN